MWTRKNNAGKGTKNNQKRRDFNTVEMLFLFVSGEMGDAYLGLYRDRDGRMIWLNHRYDHINHATLALFRDAYNPLSTMRKDIFNEMIIDFFKDRPLRTYKDVVIERKQS